MKENLSLAAACLLFFVLVSTSSCKKIIDEIVKKPNGVAGDCRITTVTSRLLENYNVNDTARFSYDSKGNPVSIEHSIFNWFVENIGESPNHYFKYYPDGKLALYLENSNPYKDRSGRNGYYATWWHKYSYIGSNLIIDTAFAYANGYIDETFRPQSDIEHNSKPVTKLHLDTYGRVIKSELFYDGQLSSSADYTYDTNGNLILPNVSYNTTKYNFRQTNKVWMLISRNYSVNSAVDEASSYTDKKLPVNINIMPRFFFDMGVFPSEYFDSIKFNYQCK